MPRCSSEGFVVAVRGHLSLDFSGTEIGEEWSRVEYLGQFHSALHICPVAQFKFSSRSPASLLKYECEDPRQERESGEAIFGHALLSGISAGS